MSHTNRIDTPPMRRALNELRRKDTSNLLREALEDAERANYRAQNGYAIIRGRRIRGEIE